MPGSFDANQAEGLTRTMTAWSDLMDELKKVGVDTPVDRDSDLGRALQKYAEETVALRMVQPDNIHDNALAKIRDEYPGKYDQKKEGDKCRSLT